MTKSRNFRGRPCGRLRVDSQSTRSTKSKSILSPMCTRPYSSSAHDGSSHFNRAGHSTEAVVLRVLSDIGPTAGCRPWWFSCDYPFGLVFSALSLVLNFQVFHFQLISRAACWERFSAYQYKRIRCAKTTHSAIIFSLYTYLFCLRNN